MMQADGRTDRQEAQLTNAYIITTSRDIEATRHGTVVWSEYQRQIRTAVVVMVASYKNAHLYMNIYIRE